VQNPDIKIGINIGKTSCEDRGITVYTRNILARLDQAGPNCHFVLLHYPGRAPNDRLGMASATLEPMLYSDRHSPTVTILNEQLLNPLHQKKLGLDVVWHPHNRCQLITPVGYVSTMHDILPIARPELAGQYLDRIDKKTLYASRTRTARQADGIITDSEFSKSEIVKHLGVDPNKVTPIHCGIDHDTFNPHKNENDRARIQTTYSLPDRYLLTTGSYAPHKNLSVLVDAFSQSDLPGENVGLVTVGPNDATGYARGYRQIQDHVRQLGLSGKVRLLPSVPFKDLVAIYSNATIFALASEYEGFGFTPLEAMACGVPVVASNVASVPEVCGNAALYADPQDAPSFANHFNHLLESGKMREQLIKKGRSQANRFDWQTTTQKTLEVLCEVANSRR